MASNLKQNTPIVVEEPKSKTSSSGFVKYTTPDPSKFTFDESSGYYYDYSTGFYYDANTHYYFNPLAQQYMYWDPLTTTYMPAPVSTTTSVVDETQMASKSSDAGVKQQKQQKASTKTAAQIAKV